MIQGTIPVRKQTKDKFLEIKKRTRLSTHDRTLEFLINLYTQVTKGMSRGEEIEFVESVEGGKAREWLERAWCKQVEQGIKQKDEQEGVVVEGERKEGTVTTKREANGKRKKIKL